MDSDLIFKYFHVKYLTVYLVWSVLCQTNTKLLLTMENWLYGVNISNFDILE